MRVFGLILLAGLISALVAEAANYAVTYWAPCQGEGLACTMDGIVGSIASLAMVVIAMVAFGAVMFWKPRPAALLVVLAALFLPVGFLLTITLQEIVVLRDGWSFYWREVQKLLQIVAAPALVAVVQWLIFRAYVARASLARRG